jgi:hypothetical protein
VKTTAFITVVVGVFASLAAAQDERLPSPAQLPSQSTISRATCNDITKTDFRNFTVHTAQRTFAFHDGVAKNGPLEETPTNGAAERQHEWKAEIQNDTVVRPSADAVVRFLLIHDSHDTGSGWRLYLIGFRCSDGKLEQVFHRDGMSLSVDRLDAIGVTVGLTEGHGNSHRKLWSYTWDGHTYALSSTQ